MTLRIKSIGFAIGVEPYYDTELKQQKYMFLLRIFGHLFVSC